MKTLCYKIGLFLAIIGSLIRIRSAQAPVPDLAFTFDDTDFSFFTLAENNINWVEAETECINWGGHLATIKSEQVDSLFYYTIEDIQIYTSCYIGLNDRQNDAGTNASAFVWVDGSTSSYRKFGNTPGTIQYPIGLGPNNIHDCVRLRYRSGTGISNGWINGACTLGRNCYFCNKPVTPSECDLIYDGLCYRLYEVSTGINWLDAQSSCAVWGGDLTSITTERENNYLYTIIPDTVSNCWIGLNDRSEEGTYTWTDGLVYSYTNWIGSEPSNFYEDCVDMIKAEGGSWETADCEITTIKTFLCKRPSSVTTAVRFGQLTNGRLEFETISENTFLYKSLTLACRGDEASAIVWKFSKNSDLSNSVFMTATYSSTDTGLSWLAVNINKQGFYQCQVNSLTYTIGLHDTSLTTVAVSGSTYTYIVGIDREDVLLLCAPTDTVSLSLLRWTLLGAVSNTDFLNPINIYEERDNLSDQSTDFNCMRGSSTLSTNFISVKVPELTIQIGSIIASRFTAVCPVVNEIVIPLTTNDISLFTNIDGKWNILGTTNSTGSTTTIDNFIEGNAGLYKFYMNNWDRVDVCAIQITLISSPAITTAIREISTAKTTFGYFTNSANINWITAQLYCINWGGNLATIESVEEDSLLFYSITDLAISYSCWIGLNDIDIDAGTNADAFVWIDGSASSYRNFDSLLVPNPSDANANFDCVSFRYRYRSGAQVLSTGWINRGCGNIRNCYFCSQPGNSQGCDLIYDEFCYRLFEVSDGINWLDAQSSCAVWGGDLTSITTERENNYLYIIIPDIVSNCWIGLNDRSVEGTYTWTDGSVYSHTNWTGSEPSNIYEHCVDIIRAGEGSWGTVDCGTMRNAFLCKRPSSVTTAVRFGQLTNGRLDFVTISENTFLFTSHTLAYGGEENIAITWIFSENSDLSSSQPETATNENIQGGWSWLAVDITKQGYYQCQVNSLTYTIGLYDPSLTTVAVSGTTYNYTLGVDRQNVVLLCDPMDSGNLSALIWSVEGSATLPNPINIYKMIGDKSMGYYSINCSRDSDEISKNKIYSRVPQIILQYGDLIIEKFSSVYPVMNNIEIPIGITNISISNTIEGRWMLPDGSYSFSTLEILTFTSQYKGVYKLYITNWDGLEVCAIQINITVTTDGIEEITNFNIPLQVNYTVGSIIDILYYSYTEIPDTKIRWTTDPVNDGENMEYSIEYPNPVLLIAVFSNVGAGLHTITSFYRMSPITSLGSLQLAIKDTVEVTISYEGYTFTTSDISNEIFPSPQVISILQGTKDITLTCSLPVCVWKISNEKDTIIASTNSISEITLNFYESFSLVRSTSSGVEYTTAHITIQTPKEASTNSTLVPIIIIVLLLICIIVATIILVPIFIFLYVKRRRPTKVKLSKRPKPSKSNITGDESNPDYTILSEMNPQTKKYIDLSVNTNPDDMTIDGTSITTLDAPTNPNERGYANLSNIPHQNVTKKEKRGYIEMKEVLTYEEYTPMNPVEEENKFTAKFIPIKEFPTMYQQYVESGIGNDSLFSVEFQKLNEDSKKAVASESYDALKKGNLQKNPIKNILPFDENRVVLDSPHFVCDYINASWLESFQFIATINPTLETHLDFLQMIYQTEASMVIMLTTRKEKATILSGISNRICYWPKKDEPINCEPFVSTLINSTETNAFVKQEISLKNTLAGKEHSFTQCISPIWNEDGTVFEMALADILLIRIMKQKQDSNNVPIIIHCENGISKTGIIMTVLNSIRELNMRKSISIFNAVKNLRRQRINMAPTLACYTTCYSLLNEYCSIHL
ncbi:Macrophage mannose receptor 1 [Oopsacas minuta]|uniref:Macrophage mannose receptor 1 n=1 Tax=Oopsacas minuta TaxID=111878 RepID=A0AAV7KBG1_9METZ|nr:Macrophage mannose receptor 1 [Oopsacas minuta]